MSENFEIEDFLVSSSIRNSGVKQNSDSILEIEEKLAKLKPFIDQNKFRIPNFNSSADAEVELRNLQSQLKKTPKISRIRDKRGLFDSEMKKISDQHKQIEEEKETITKYRKSAKESRKSEEKELKEFKKQLYSAKNELTEARSHKSNIDFTYTELKKSIDEQEKANSALLKRKEKLLEEEQNLISQKSQLIAELQNAMDKNAQCDQDEKTLTKLEKATAEKMGRVREMQRDLSVKQSKIEKMIQEIKRLTDEANQTGNHYDSIIAKAANLKDSTVTFNESDESSQLSSESESDESFNALDSSLLDMKPEELSSSVHIVMKDHQPIEKQSSMSNTYFNLVTQDDEEEEEEEDENEKEISQIKTRIRELRNVNVNLNDYEYEYDSSNEEEEELVSTSPIKEQRESPVKQFNVFSDSSSDEEVTGVMTKYGKFAEDSSDIEEEESADNQYNYTETSIKNQYLNQQQFSFDDDEEEDSIKETKIKPLSQYDALLSSDSDLDESDTDDDSDIINDALKAIQASIVEPTALMKKY